MFPFAVLPASVKPPDVLPVLPPSLFAVPPYMPHTVRRNPDFLNKRACAHMYTRLIGRSTHFQNLSTRNVAQIFLHVLRADPPEPTSAEKRLASKERGKCARLPLGRIWGRRKNAGGIVFLPNGGGATHRRTARHNGHSTSIARTACKRRQRRQDTKGR